MFKIAKDFGELYLINMKKNRYYYLLKLLFKVMYYNGKFVKKSRMSMTLVHIFK